MRRGERIAAIPLMISAALAAAGCSDDGPAMMPIRGEVLYDGKPLEEGQVVYLPKNPRAGRQASGPVKPDGTFVLTTQKAGDGAMYGEYDVVVFGYGTDPAKDAQTREAYEAAQQGKRLSSIPEKYSRRDESGISDVVNAEHTGFKRIELPRVQ